MDRGATRTAYELSAVPDLQGPECRVRFILTVQKLREGWDCPFAYVLCSLLPTRSATAMEQIIGRVLRMPGAEFKRSPVLNSGYVYAVSPTPEELRNELTGALTNTFGLSREEASRELANTDAPTLPIPVREPQTVQVAPGGEGLNAELVTAIQPFLRGRVEIDPHAGTVTILAPLTATEREQAAVCIRAPEARAEFAAAATRVAEMAAADYAGTGDNGRRVSPSERLENFFVPSLCVMEDGELLRLDQSDVLDPDLDLENADAGLPGFPTNEPPGTGLKIDVTATGQLRLDRDNSFIGELRFQTLQQGRERDWPLEKLIAWLDWKIPHDDIEAHRMGEFLRRTLNLLVTGRGKHLPELIVRRYELRDALTARLRELRKRTRAAAFADLALEGSTLTVGPDDLGMNLARMPYHQTVPYTGSFRFQKHYFPTVGDLKSAGEEFDCAVFIDGLDAVRFWVRNVARLRGAFRSRLPQTSFIPTSFVC